MASQSTKRVFVQFLRGGGAVTLKLDSKPATIPLSTYAVAGDWLRLVFKDNNDTYEYETAKQWSKESAESDTPSPLPPVEGNDGQLLMSQNGQWTPVNANGGFGYVDEPTILFAGNVSDFEEGPKGVWEVTIPLTDAPDDLFPRSGDVTKVVITDPNGENITMLAENSIDGLLFDWITDTGKTNEIFYEMYEDHDDVYLYIHKDTDDPIEISITLEGNIHTIDQRFALPHPTAVDQVLVSAKSDDELYWNVQTLSTPLIVLFDWNASNSTYTFHNNSLDQFDTIMDALMSGRGVICQCKRRSNDPEYMWPFMWQTSKITYHLGRETTDSYISIDVSETSYNSSSGKVSMTIEQLNVMPSALGQITRRYQQVTLTPDA